MMNTALLQRTTVSAATTGRLYLIRGVIALIWAGLLAAAVSSSGSLTPEQTVPAFAVALLISYPLIDVVASLVDARSSRHGAPRNATAQFVNAAISAVAAAAIAVAASHGADAILRVFGAWALLTGLIQLILAIVRRRRGTPGQLPMILSGSISSRGRHRFHPDGEPERTESGQLGRVRHRRSHLLPGLGLAPALRAGKPRDPDRLPRARLTLGKSAPPIGHEAVVVRFSLAAFRSISPDWLAVKGSGRGTDE